MTLVQTEPKGIYIGKSIIPDEYQEVEYIVSNGRNCCINTGIYPDREDFEVNFVFLNATSYSNDAYIFGTSASKSSPRLTIKLSATAGYYYVYINNNSGAAQTVGGWNLGLNTKHDVTIKANRANGTFNFKVGSVDTTVSYNPNVAYNTPIRFFCYQSDTSTIGAGDMKVYRFKLKNSGILVRDMIPCYRKSDGTIGMYDIVNDVFYSNVNSGTLGEGNDINGLPVTAVYLGDTKVRPKWEWKPGANTRVYLPLESDVVDKSGKSGRTFTTSGISYTTVGGVLSAHGTGSNYIRMDTPYPLVNESGVDTNNLTVSLWFYVTSNYSSTRRSLFEFTRYSNQNITLALKENTYIIQGNDGGWYGSDTTYNTNVWNNVILTASGTNKKIYINGILKWSGSTGYGAWGYWGNSGGQTQAIITGRDLTQEGLVGNMREFIIEDKEWTVQDVSNYYNQTKANFGL